MVDGVCGYAAAGTGGRNSLKKHKKSLEVGYIRKKMYPAPELLVMWWGFVLRRGAGGSLADFLQTFR